MKPKIAQLIKDMEEINAQFDKPYSINPGIAWGMVQDLIELSRNLIKELKSE